MRVLVCGGRAYHDEAAVHRALDALEGVTLVINGGASGADLWARRWAKNNTVANETFIAEWGRHGRSAGPRRNSAMLALGKPDLVLAFPGGRGTRDMVAKAIKAGVRVVEPSELVKETPESEHVGETCKPVAWAYVNPDGECEQIEWGSPPEDPDITLLYLHPPRKRLAGDP